MTNPAVSVIMPVRNGDRWLAEACRSVLDQTLADLELIVVDDGSEDGTSEILKALSHSDRRVRVQRQRSRGLVAALNLGIAMAEAPLIARLDADDIARPERLSRQVGFLAANPGTVLLGTWADRIDADGHRIGRLRPETDSIRLAAMLLTRNPFVHSTVLIRAQALSDAGGYRSACEAAEDYDLWLRLSERGDVAILPDALVYYRRHEASVSQQAAVRQSFSTRVARRAANMRRTSGRDPLSGIAEPPDWWANEAAPPFWAEDADLARFLAMAAPESLQLERLQLVEVPSQRTLESLSHVEKKLARRAAINLLAVAFRPPQLSTGRLVRLWGALLLGRWI